MSGRPRLNVGAPASTAPDPTPVAAPVEEPPTAPTPPGEGWTRPEPPAAPTPDLSTVAPSTATTTGEYRRSSGPKKNHTVSVPAELAAAVRARATAERWSVTDLVFLAVERYRTRLRAAPELPGRELGPRPAVARAHLVLYLADEEWAAWQESAVGGGLKTPSRLVTDALAAFV